MAPKVVDLPTLRYNDIVQRDSSAAAQLFKAASTDGFFQLDLRDSIAQADVLNALSAVYKAGEEYFAQSADVKEKDRRIGDSTDRGFDTSTCDETLELSIDEYRAGNTFPAVFEAKRETIGSFMETLDHACRLLLASLSSSLGLDDTDSLAKFHDKSDSSESGLKFIDEPTLARIADVGDNLHTDGGTFTVVFCEKFGLQAYFPSTAQWGFIPPKEGCCVVNVADALDRFSNGKLHSPKHRVTQMEDGAGERFYLSYFLRPSHKHITK